MNTQIMAAPTADLTMIKTRQQAVWGAGDYAVIGTRLQIVGEMLCEAVDMRAGERVLDVAAGNGNATLAAARRFADVTSTDYVEALLDKARARAEADGLDATFRVADAENLPFADESFDVVLSTFGVMFTPDQEKAARELMRVCRKGGRIGLANWTPDGFIGQLFKTIGRHVPPAPGVKSPALWGTTDHLARLFGPGAAIAATPRTFMFRYRSASHWVEVFRSFYGPVLKAFAALDGAGQTRLENDLIALLGTFNTATDGTIVIPGEYLEIVVTRSA